MSGTRLSEPAVLEPAGADPAPPAGGGIGREAGRRIVLFVLVLLVAASAAFGAGRLLSAGLGPVQTSGHDMSGHDMSGGMSGHDMSGGMSDMPGTDMTGPGR